MWPIPDQSTKSRPPKTLLRRIVGGVFGGATLVGLLCVLMLPLIKDVIDGKGLDPYFTADGVKMNAIGALVAIALALPLILIASWLPEWRKWRERSHKTSS